MELIDYSRERFENRPGRAIVVSDRCAVFEVQGPGTLDCLQGLLTNDLVKPGPWSLVYGAFLTSKGMIVVDYWVFRSDDRFVLLADQAGHDRSLELFRRQLPPRLARVTDRSEDWAVLWILGPAEDALRALGEPPGPGRATRLSGKLDAMLVGRGGARAPMTYLVCGPTDELTRAIEALSAAQVEVGSQADLRAARVRVGFPTLGREIEERTLPLEVGYEEIDGVSYTKGCYVGQETVARVHFRGHPNWLLRGVRFKRDEALTAEIAVEGKPAARLKTLIRFEDGSGVGLALVRREIAPGTTIPVGDDGLAIVALPF